VNRLLPLWCLYGLLLLGVLSNPQDATAQGNYLRIVNLLSGPSALDGYYDNVTPATFGDVQYEYADKPLTSPQSTGAGLHNIKMTVAGTGIGNPLIDQDVTFGSLTDYTAVAYGTQVKPKFKVLTRNRATQPQPDNSLIRVMHAGAVTSAFDIYLDSLNGPPLFGAVAQDSVTAYKEVHQPEPQHDKPVNIYITRAGTKAVVGAFSSSIGPLTQGELPLLTFFISGTTETTLKVYVLHGEDDTRHPLAVLGTVGIMFPSVRGVNAWPGKTVSSLDFFLDNQPKTLKVFYEGASASADIAKDSVTVTFAPAEEGVESAVWSEGLKVNRDTGYAVVLTQHKDGALTSMILKSYLQEPNSTLKVRFANASDFFGPISIVLRPENGDTIHFDNVSFLTYTGWRPLPTGNVSLEAYHSGVDTAFYQGAFLVDGNKLMSLIALGDNEQVAVVLLDESVSARIPHMESFSGPVQSVAADREAAARALHLTNAPNPFGSSTRLSFMLPKSGNVQIDLYDALGRRVTQLVDEWLASGSHTLELRGDELDPGVYLCIVQAGGVQAAHRLMIVR
jgi:hypothetical protein